MSVWEVVLEGRQGPNDMLNVFHYDDLGTPPGDWGDVAAVFEGHIDDHLVPLAGSRVTWLGITYRADSLGAVGSFVPFPGGTLTGTNGSGDHADVVAMQVKKLSGGVVRPTYGWFMQGGITLDATETGNSWAALIRADVAAYAEDIRVLSIAGPSTLQMVIKASNPGAPNTQPYTPVNTMATRADPRTQRSRLAASGS